MYGLWRHRLPSSQSISRTCFSSESLCWRLSLGQFIVNRPISLIRHCYQVRSFFLCQAVNGKLPTLLRSSPVLLTQRPSPPPVPLLPTLWTSSLCRLDPYPGLYPVPHLQCQHMPLPVALDYALELVPAPGLGLVLGLVLEPVGLGSLVGTTPLWGSRRSRSSISGFLLLPRVIGVTFMAIPPHEKHLISPFGRNWRVVLACGL